MASTAAPAEDSQASGGRKGGGGDPSVAVGPVRAPEQGLRCPRCDSPNTKFCYYNNYSLSQPRHFCKTCRRYWTKGGALRNVPVGGGCRKNKRSRSAAAAASSRLSLGPVEPGAGAAPDPGGLSYLRRSPPLGAAEFPVGMLPFPRLNSPTTNQYMPFGEFPSAAVPASLLGFNYPVASTAAAAYPQEMAGAHGLSSSAAVSSSIASSIESLSFINQDLHWKLQQQRLAAMFLGPAAGDANAPHREGGASAAHEGGGFLAGQQPYGQLALHTVGDGCTSNAGQHGKGCFATVASSAVDTMPATWFMESSYTLPAAATTSGGGGGDSNNCNGAVPGWSDVQTFAMLP